MGTSAVPVARGSPSTVPVPQFPLVSTGPWANGVPVTPQSPELVPPAGSPRPMGCYGIVTREPRPCPFWCQHHQGSEMLPEVAPGHPLHPKTPGEAGSSGTPLLQPHPHRGSPLAEHPGHCGTQEEQTGGRILLREREESPGQSLIPPSLSPETRSSPSRQRCRRALLCRHANTAASARQCHAGDKRDR